MFLDFGISAGQKRVCTYYRYTDAGKFDQTTCGGASFNAVNDPNLENIGVLGLPERLEGRSLIQQRAETLHTHTGSIRGSFVSFLSLSEFIVQETGHFKLFAARN